MNILWQGPKDFLEDELRPLEHTYENVLVVCHGALIRALLLNVLGWDIDRYWEIHQPNCCMNLVTLKDGKFNLAYMEKIYYEGDIAAKRNPVMPTWNSKRFKRFNLRRIYQPDQ